MTSPSSGACAEKQLLARCARTRVSPQIAKEIRALASNKSGELDGDYLVSEAANNAVTPLVALQLRALGSDVAPPGLLERLQAAAHANTVRCLLLSAELLKIMAEFDSRGIRGIPYKGPALAAQAYGDMTLREFEDLDVILPQRDLQKAHDAMLAMGYAPKFPDIVSPQGAGSFVPGEYNYRDATRRITVELHTERTLRHFPVAPDLGDRATEGSLAARLVPVALGGQTVRTFSPEDGLPILCVHGAKDFWERISWVADISELIESQPRLDWDQAFRRAESWKAERMLHLGLALAIELLDAPLPPEIASRVQKDGVASGLASEISLRLLSREKIFLGAAERFRFRRCMLPNALDGWRYAIRLAVMPAEEDWFYGRLPRPLAPLYVALRPLRLLRKYFGLARHPR